MPTTKSLLRFQRSSFLAPLARQLLALQGIEVPDTVKLGQGILFVHRAHGLICHPLVEIGQAVTIYPDVTIGRSRPWVPMPDSRLGGARIEDGSILCTGAKILFDEKKVTIGKFSVVGANSVVTRSVPPGEVWAGVPAVKIGDR